MAMRVSRDILSTLISIKTYPDALDQIEILNDALKAGLANVIKVAGKGIETRRDQAFKCGVYPNNKTILLEKELSTQQERELNNIETAYSMLSGFVDAQTNIDDNEKKTIHEELSAIEKKLLDDYKRAYNIENFRNTLLAREKDIFASNLYRLQLEKQSARGKGRLFTPYSAVHFLSLNPLKEARYLKASVPEEKPEGRNEYSISNEQGEPVSREVGRDVFGGEAHYKLPKSGEVTSKEIEKENIRTIAVQGGKDNEIARKEKVLFLVVKAKSRGFGKLNLSKVANGYKGSEKARLQRIAVEKAAELGFVRGQLLGVDALSEEQINESIAKGNLKRKEKVSRLEAIAAKPKRTMPEVKLPVIILPKLLDLFRRPEGGPEILLDIEASDENETPVEEPDVLEEEEGLDEMPVEEQETKDKSVSGASDDDTSSVSGDSVYGTPRPSIDLEKEEALKVSEKAQTKEEGYESESEEEDKDLEFFPVREDWPEDETDKQKELSTPPVVDKKLKVSGGKRKLESESTMTKNLKDIVLGTIGLLAPYKLELKKGEDEKTGVLRPLANSLNEYEKKKHVDLIYKKLMSLDKSEREKIINPPEYSEKVVMDMMLIENKVVRQEKLKSTLEKLINFTKNKGMDRIVSLVSLDERLKKLDTITTEDFDRRKHEVADIIDPFFKEYRENMFNELMRFDFLVKETSATIKDVIDLVNTYSSDLAEKKKVKKPEVDSEDEDVFYDLEDTPPNQYVKELRKSSETKEELKKTFGEEKTLTAEDRDVEKLLGDHVYADSNFVDNLDDEIRIKVKIARLRVQPTEEEKRETPNLYEYNKGAILIIYNKLLELKKSDEWKNIKESIVEVPTAWRNYFFGAESEKSKVREKILNKILQDLELNFYLKEPTYNSITDIILLVDTYSDQLEPELRSNQRSSHDMSLHDIHGMQEGLEDSDEEGVEITTEDLKEEEEEITIEGEKEEPKTINQVVSDLMKMKEPDEMRTYLQDIDYSKDALHLLERTLKGGQEIFQNKLKDIIMAPSSVQARHIPEIQKTIVTQANAIKAVQNIIKEKESKPDSIKKGP